MVEIFDDIRKIYRFGNPCEELADYIEFFSESSARETSRCFPGKPFTVKMFPSWTPTIWLNLGAPYTLDLGHRQYPIGRNRNILVLRDSIVSRHNQPSDYIFTIKFLPGGLQAIFGINQTRLIGRIGDAKDILPPSFIENVKGLPSFEERIRSLEEFFLAQRSKKQSSDYYRKLMRESVGLYLSSGMYYNTSETAEKLFTTSRSLRRYFHTVVGTSPKKYFSILRARAALTAYTTGKNTFDPCCFGYYDISHFYREAMKFTGQRMTCRP